MKVLFVFVLFLTIVFGGCLIISAVNDAISVQMLIKEHKECDAKGITSKKVSYRLTLWPFLLLFAASCSILIAFFA